MNHIFLYLLGILFVSFGIFFTIIYLNVFAMGYSFLDFGKFIIRKLEFWFILIGILFLILERWIKK